MRVRNARLRNIEVSSYAAARLSFRPRRSTMLQERIADLSKCVEPDRVRREVYTDTEIFELEMRRIHEQVWIYCGHESQVPKPGDYYTVQIGRQPMLMVRATDGRISVLYNRCPHRGNMMCGDRHGNAGEFFRCSYHAWTFQHDGRLRSIPMMESGYAGTRYGRDNPDCSMKRAARVESYRGFVFASLAKDGPALAEFLGASRVAFDDMCDRAPAGEVEIVPTAFASSSTPTGRSSSRTSSTPCIPRWCTSPQAAPRTRSKSRSRSAPGRRRCPTTCFRPSRR